MCKKETAFSHNSTKSEIISSDIGLRIDGLLALELWDLIGSISDRTGKPVNDENKHLKSHKKIDVVKDIDSVLSNVQSANCEALLYVFEDKSCNLNDYVRKKSYNETRLQNSQNYS